MKKATAIESLQRYHDKCSIAISNASYDPFGNEYVSFSDFNLIKISVISLFKALNVDNAFIESIQKFNGQQVDEIETIRNYIEEVKAQIETEMYDDVSVPLLKEYDVFLSHANKDKDSFVDSLYQELTKMGVKVFYDKDSISWGDNWEEKIKDALKKCEFGIVVISKNFFNREWTEKELEALLDRKNAIGQKLVLPIFYGVKIKAVKRRYPQVASIQSLPAEKYSQKDIAILFAKELIARIKGGETVK